ncbi:hypothetical protein BMI85_16185 [Thioclava sp. DLFJ4-1]|nr:hypothetical protein BMI85_16185 [Thioclava sp. DLFJ4-1]
MADIWGPWIEHDGKGCPVPVGTICHLVWRDGLEIIANVEGSGSWVWGDLRYSSTSGRNSYGEPLVPIVRYRIRKLRGLTILQEIAAYPQPVREDA